MQKDSHLPRRNLNPSPDRIAPPVRHTAPAAPAPNPVPRPLPPTDPKELARARQDFGFGDIPVEDDDMENVRFRDILRAWAKQSVQHSPLEDKIKAAAAKKGRFNDLKNDLKWAMQADLDEPVKVTTPKPSGPQTSAAMRSDVIAAPNVQRQVPSENKSIDININFGSLPKLPSPKKIPAFQNIGAKARGFHWTRRRLVGAGSLVALIAIGTVAWSVIPSLQSGPLSRSEAIPTTDLSLETPDYRTLLPKGKSIAALGGWHRISPPEKTAVFAYVDKIDDVSINVSQQPLPDTFKSDVDKSIAELAKGYAATDKIDADSMKIYVGTSAQGPQSVILAKNDTLILIKSTKKISDDAWTAYAKSLN